MLETTLVPSVVTNIRAEKITTFSLYKIPVLVLDVDGKKVHIINMGNNYYTLLPFLRPNKSKQVSVESSDGNPYSVIQELLYKNGYGCSFQFLGNFKLIIDYMNLTVRFYKKHTIIKYVDNSFNELKCVIVTKDCFVELVPGWNFQGMYLEVRPYGNSIILDKDTNGKQSGIYKFSDDLQIDMKICFRDSGFFLVDDTVDLEKGSKNLQFYRISLGKVDMCFWSGTRHYSAPKNKWFIMLIKDNNLVDYTELN